MRLGLIKNNICENIIIAQSVQTAKELFPIGEYDDFIAISDSENCGTGDQYKDGVWTSTKPITDYWVCPNCSNTSPISLRVCDVCGFDASGLF